MSSQKESLEKQEKALRSELNQVSDELEKKIFKIATAAIVSGAATYGAYKLLSKGNKKKIKKEKIKSSKKEGSVIQSIINSDLSKKLLVRLLTAAIPIVLAVYDSQNKKQDD